MITSDVFGLQPVFTWRFTCGYRNIQSISVHLLKGFLFIDTKNDPYTHNTLRTFGCRFVRANFSTKIASEYSLWTFSWISVADLTKKFKNLSNQSCPYTWRKLSEIISILAVQQTKSSQPTTRQQERKKTRKIERFSVHPILPPFCRIWKNKAF